MNYRILPSASQTTPDIFATRQVFGASATGPWVNFPQWTINLTVGGRCTWKDDEEYFQTGPGRLLLVRPLVSLSWHLDDENRNGWETVYAAFHPRPHWRTWLDAFPYIRGEARLQLSGEARREILALMNKLARIYAAAGSMRDERALAALEVVLIALYEHTVQPGGDSDPRVQRALDFIHINYGNQISGSDIARITNLSVAQTTTLFSVAIGMTPGQYLEHVRLSRAAEMLRYSSVKVIDIALACGYPDANYFSRRFRYNFGKTPSEYRAAMLGKQES